MIEQDKNKTNGRFVLKLNIMNKLKQLVEKYTAISN